MTIVSFDKNLSLFFCICIAVMFIQLTPSVAADIRRSSSPECLITLEGIIEKGDYQKFRGLADEVFPNFDADSTIRHLLCLNSLGGSFSEGVLFATHFLEKGVGTVIRANESCMSVCAIMFMMGSHIGPELAGLNRKLHVLGTLGFHRPYVPSKYTGLVEAKNIVLAFDGAFSSALDLLALANKKAPWSSDPMIKSDLIQSMLNHKKDDFFLIDTIDKAGRWDIELLGMKSTFGSTLERAFYACENMLQWQNGQTTFNTSLEFVILNDVNYFPHIEVAQNTTNDPVFKLLGLGAGYVNESCIIQFKDRYVFGCGFDENTDVSFGSNECNLTTSPEKYEYIPNIPQIFPWTKLKDLAATENENRARKKQAKCYVLKSSNILDNEKCFASFEEISSLSSQVISFEWPSGSKTIIEINNGEVYLNGARAESRFLKGYDNCFWNSVTKNMFCFIGAEKDL